MVRFVTSLAAQPERTLRPPRRAFPRVGVAWYGTVELERVRFAMPSLSPLSLALPLRAGGVTRRSLTHW